jgi:hypothetical protein
MSVLMQFLRENWLLFVVIGGLAVLWTLLHTPADRVESLAAFDEQVSAGRPVVVELFSNT